jgi:outer membrane immunogenic protein
MRRFAMIGAGLFSIAGFISSAPAADLPAQTYNKTSGFVEPPYSWVGFYVGGSAGYGWSNDSYTFTNNVGITENFKFDPGSFVGGGQIGAQGQIGNWVIGAEGSFSWMNLQQTDVAFLVPGAQRSLSLQNIATVTGKLGYAWDHWMVYGKGGWADTEVKPYTFNPANGLASRSDAWQSGWTAGGGIDYMFARNWIVGGEFNYYKFNFDRTQSNQLGLGAPGHVANGTADLYSVLVHVNYLFNWGAPVIANY